MKIKALLAAVLMISLLAGCSLPVGTYMPLLADPVSNVTVSSEDMLTEQDAKQIALDHAKVAEAEAYNLTVHLDMDDGITHYDVEFYTQYFEYEYEIHAVSGRIMTYEREK